MSDIQIYPFYDSEGNDLGYTKVSKYFTLEEFKKASFGDNITSIPISLNLLYAMDYLREILGKPIIINSHFRTVAHEIRKGRSGRSQHTLGKAVDLSGTGLVDLIDRAIKEKNEVYEKLRELGVNAFGIYDNFVHIDVRPKKLLGGIYYWDKRGKKKTELDKDDDDAPFDWSKVVLIGIGVLLLFKKIIKNEKRKK